MRFFLIFAAGLLTACPKHPAKSLDEAEREEKLRELLEEEEFDDLPEDRKKEFSQSK